MSVLKITLIGGPTALIELGSFRLLTDPTFDPPGEYHLPYVTLKKTSQPALGPGQLGAVDAVLLSHDQHADNLDNSGRALLEKVGRVFTTIAGAKRLERTAEGLAPWEVEELRKHGGDWLRITATPARHGPAGIESLAGQVIGFVVSSSKDGHADHIYITGDTVWYEGIAEVARRFHPWMVLPFAGAAQTRGPFHLTMDTNDVVETAYAFPEAVIVPLHCDGWAHLTQSRNDLAHAFDALMLRSRLRLLEPGVVSVFES